MAAVAVAIATGARPVRLSSVCRFRVPFPSRFARGMDMDVLPHRVYGVPHELCLKAAGSRERKRFDSFDGAVPFIDSRAFFPFAMFRSSHGCETAATGLIT